VWFDVDSVGEAPGTCKKKSFTKNQ
jgi:hypothetical protein